jgi:hypothetical protein
MTVFSFATHKCSDARYLSPRIVVQYFSGVFGLDYTLLQESSLRTGLGS